MQTHAWELATRLHSRGHRVEVLTYRSRDPEAEAIDRSAPFPVRRVLSRISHWLNLETVARRAASGADLVYASTVYFGLVSGIAGVPVVCRSAGNDIQRPWIVWPFRWGSSLAATPWLEDSLYGWFRRRRNPAWLQQMLRRHRNDLVTRSLLANAYVFANSAYTAALVRERGLEASRCEVLPGGVDTASFAAAHRDASRKAFHLDASRFWLLTACRLVPKKGIDFLLHSLKEIQKRYPDTGLLIAGDGPERAAYERLAAQLDLGAAVRFLGRLPREEMPRAFAAADAFVLASRDTVQKGMVDAETMGRVLCEANAAGRPVIAARCGGIPSLIEDGHNGLLFPPGNIIGLVGAYSRLRQHPDLAARLVACGRRAAASRFEWRRIVDRHEQVFAQVAAVNRCTPSSIAELNPSYQAGLEAG
jgi:glycosyltransferase involved in cell wall biosynthesis